MSQPGREAEAARRQRPDPKRRRPLRDSGAVRSLVGGDAGLSALLAAQLLLTFVIVPLTAAWPGRRMVLDLAYAVIATMCALALTKRSSLRMALLGAVVLLVAGPPLWDQLSLGLRLGAEVRHEFIVTTAFGFIALVTAVAARAAFGPGRVTVHHVLGAVLVYLNVAILFAIAFELLTTNVDGAIKVASGGALPRAAGLQLAELSYFSLSTITSVSYGDLVPVHPLARSLANLEGMFGQLFPPIFIARQVALQLADDRRRGGGRSQSGRGDVP